MIVTVPQRCHLHYGIVLGFARRLYAINLVFYTFFFYRDYEGSELSEGAENCTRFWHVKWKRIILFVFSVN